MRRVALDEARHVGAVRGVAVDVRRGEAGAVVERHVVAGVAVGRVRAGLARGHVVRPLAEAAQVGARHVREALALADVRADAVDGVEVRLEQLVAAVEGHLEGFFEVACAHELHH